MNLADDLRKVKASLQLAWVLFPLESNLGDDGDAFVPESVVVVVVVDEFGDDGGGVVVAVEVVVGYGARDR